MQFHIPKFQPFNDVKSRSVYLSQYIRYSTIGNWIS